MLFRGLGLISGTGGALARAGLSRFVQGPGLCMDSEFLSPANFVFEALIGLNAFCTGWDMMQFKVGSEKQGQGPFANGKGEPES